MRISPRAAVWLRMALRERDAAAVMRGGRFHDLAAYHLHQAIEKMLKALLLNESLEPPRTHDLVKLHGILSNALPAQDRQNEQISSLLRKVSIFHVMARYPVVDETTASEDWITEEDVALAASAWEAVSEMAARTLGVSEIDEARHFVTAMRTGAMANSGLETLGERKERRRSEVIASLKEWLRVRSPPVGMRTILFGSFARLSFDAWSDVDVALIARERETLEEVRSFAIELLSWRPPHGAGVDVVCLTEDGWRSSGLSDAIAAGILIDCRDDSPSEAAEYPSC